MLLNQKVQNISKGINNCCVLNPYKGTGYIKKEEGNKRSSFRTQSNEIKIKGIVDAVVKQITNRAIMKLS